MGIEVFHLLNQQVNREETPDIVKNFSLLMVFH